MNGTYLFDEKCSCVLKGLLYLRYYSEITKYAFYMFMTKNFVSFHMFEQFELQDAFRRLNLAM
jgi:hypothetical protein